MNESELQTYALLLCSVHCSGRLSVFFSDFLENSLSAFRTSFTTTSFVDVFHHRRAFRVLDDSGPSNFSTPSIAFPSTVLESDGWALLREKLDRAHA